jgi:hypothetical protein
MEKLEASNKDLNPEEEEEDVVSKLLKMVEERFDLVPKSKRKANTAPQPLGDLAGSLAAAHEASARPKIAGSNFGDAFFTSTPSYVPPVQAIQPVIPKIPCFSGDEPLPKGEVPFVIWRYEVNCLLSCPDLSNSHRLQILRSSLRGTARIMIIPLGQAATIDETLEKLDVMFSDASTKEDLMTEFFNSHQLPTENVTTYACRLETLLQSVISKGQLPGVARNDILRHKLWTGLYCDTLKLQTRHCYDSLVNYNQLLRELRKVEKEVSSSGQTSTPVSKPVGRVTSAKHNPLAAGSTLSSATPDISSLERRMEDRLSVLESRLTAFEEKVNKQMESKFDLIIKKLDSSNSYRGRGRGRGIYNGHNASASEHSVGQNNHQGQSN